MLIAGLLVSVSLLFGHRVSAAPTSDSRSSPRIVVVGGDHDNPPYEFLKNGVPTGFNVELIQAVAEVMNFKAVVRLGPWSEVRKSLEAGELDALAGMYYTAERAKGVDFSVAHTLVTPSVFVRDDSPIQSFEDARGREVIVQQSDVIFDLLRGQRFSSQIFPKTNPSEVMAFLAAGEHDCAVVPSKLQGYYFIEQHHLEHLRAIRADIPALQYCFAVKKGDVELLAKLNEGLNVLKRTGKYRELYGKWFGVYEVRYTHWLRVVGILAGVAGFLLLLSVAWSWSLRHQVQARTSELRESELKVRAIFDQTSELIGLLTLDGTLVEVNRTALQFVGIEREDALGLPFWETAWWKYSPELQQKIRAAIVEVGQGRAVAFGVQHLAVDGRVHHFDFSLKPQLDATGKIAFMIAEGHDITEREVARAALLRSEVRYRSVVESVNELIATIDQDGRVLYINGPGARQFGSEPARYVGAPLSELFSEGAADQQLKHVRDVLSRHEPVVVDAFTSLNGSHRWLHLTFVPAAELDQPAVHLIAVDLTDLKQAEEARVRLEEQLRQVQKMEAVGRVAGGVAHDFNNLLTPVLGYAELLLMDESVKRVAGTELEVIRVAAQRAVGLTKQLLAFCRRQVLRMQELDLVAVVSDFSQLLRRIIGEHIEIVIVADESTATIRADLSQIHQVLMNLAVNSRDAMPTGGRLVIEISSHAAPSWDSDAIAELGTGWYVVLTVSDTGDGMPPEVLEHLFEPFFTTKGPGKGTGLGLSTVYGIVKQHGGQIEVESERGKGSVFRVYFPRVAIPAGFAAVTEPDVIAPNGGGTVLIVEDDTLVRDMVNGMLKGNGYTTLCAKDGQEALELAADVSLELDVLLTDMVMPGKSGRVVYQELQRTRPKLGAVFMSGYAQDPTVLEEGAIFLRKPFSLGALLSSVASAMRK
jgi:PAS domain S-box-containing protein